MEKKARRIWFPRVRGLFRHMRGKTLPAFVTTGAMFGVAGGISFDTALGHTSKTDFCLSCHEMQVMQDELSRTAHFRSRSGMRLGCGDCHVPREQPEQLIAKIRAIDDIYGHLVGSIDTPEKFEARRLDMAETVWAGMRADGSKACRNCHSFEAMDFEAQSRRPRDKHNQAMQSGETCIDCHKGVAHALPSAFLADD